MLFYVLGSRNIGFLIFTRTLRSFSIKLQLFEEITVVLAKVTGAVSEASPCRILLSSEHK